MDEAISTFVIGILRQRYSTIPACQIKGNYIVYIRFGCVFFMACYEQHRDRIWTSRSHVVTPLIRFYARNHT